MDDDALTNPIELGKMVETAVYKHVAAFYSQRAARVGYYRGGKKNREIDVVVDYPNTKNILNEVKCREQAPIPDDSAICKLCGEASAAIVVTKRPVDYGIHHTPNGRESLPVFLRLPTCICWETRNGTAIAGQPKQKSATYFIYMIDVFEDGAEISRNIFIGNSTAARLETGR